MKRLLGGVFEWIQLVTIGALLACSTVMTALADPDIAGEHAHLTRSEAAEVFAHLGLLLHDWGTWVAGLAFASALLAPYLRADGKKLPGWIRAVAALGALLVTASLITTVEVPDKVLLALQNAEHETVQSLGDRAADGVPAWIALMGLTAANIAVAAFQIGPPQREA